MSAPYSRHLRSVWRGAGACNCFDKLITEEKSIFDEKFGHFFSYSYSLNYIYIHLYFFSIICEKFCL